MPLDVAALIEPLSVAQHAADCAGVKEWTTQSVLCVGGGPVAVAVVMILRAQGVGKVFVSEPTAKRLEYAAEITNAAIDPVKGSVGENCRSLTAGKGANVVFDCAGVDTGLKAGIDALTCGGIYVIVAGGRRLCLGPSEVMNVTDCSPSSLCHCLPAYSRRLLSKVPCPTRTKTFDKWFGRSQKVQQAADPLCLGGSDILALSLLGKFDGVSKMVTSRIAFDDVVHKGFEELVSNKDDHIKILVTPRIENLNKKAQAAHTLKVEQ